MGETRTRPARERQRFEQVTEANLWFWNQIKGYGDPNWPLVEEWNRMLDSTKIRRHNAHEAPDIDDVTA